MCGEQHPQQLEQLDQAALQHGAQQAAGQACLPMQPQQVVCHLEDVGDHLCQHSC